MKMDESIEIYYWPFELTQDEQEAWRMCSPRMREQVAQLEAIRKAVHQWSAGYPLGGGMDEIAANEIYQMCIALAEDE